MIATAIQNAVKKTNMPNGIFSMVNGTSVDVGMGIVKNHLIKAIGFTGSFKGGKAIFDAANKREEPIPVYSEMGSTNPVFILPNALKERGLEIAQGLTNSVTLGVGQFCTNPGLVFLNKDDSYSEFIENTSECFELVEANTMLNEGIKNAFEGGVTSVGSQAEVGLIAKGKSDDIGYKASAHLFETTAENFLQNENLEEEIFGPSTITIAADSKNELVESAKKLGGHLTASLFATDVDLKNNIELIEILERKVGRLMINNYPTGVEVCHAMVHGGPFPATTNSRSTSVGTGAITRFTRPVCYQSFPDKLLPDELKDSNPLNIMRLYDNNRKI